MRHLDSTRNNIIAIKMTKQNNGFTLIELVIVIVIIGILTAIAIPKYYDVTTHARIATLNGIYGAIKSNIAITRSVALSKGLVASTSNPSDQSKYIIETEAGSFELDWRNLCPESRAELGDSLVLNEHLGLEETDKLSIIVSNQYFRVGYDIQGNGPPTANGCYITYDSFGFPNCTVDLIDSDC